MKKLIKAKSQLNEYVNGGKLDQFIVVVNPRGEEPTIDDCMKLVSSDELFALAHTIPDLTAVNPVIYYASATGSAKKDAKARVTQLQRTNDLVRKANELATQAAEAAKAAAEATNQSGEPAATPEAKPEDEETANIKSIVPVGESIEALGVTFPTMAQDNAVRPVEDGEPKVIKVPADISQELTKTIKVEKELAKRCEEVGDTEQKVAHEKIADLAVTIKDLLDSGTQTDFNKAGTLFTSLNNQLQLKLPSALIKFLSSGGSPNRSLKDYFNQAKTPK